MLVPKSSSEGLFKSKGSKFQAYLYHCDTVDSAMKVLSEVQDLHSSAGHHCYAYRIGKNAEEYRVNDDGEPSGTAGKPILGQLTSFNVTDSIIIVVRYFGGTKLGVGGLIEAYKEAARSALENAELIPRVIWTTNTLEVKTELIGSVQSIINQYSIQVLNTEFSTGQCTFTLRLSDLDSDEMISRLRKLGTLNTHE